VIEFEVEVLGRHQVWRAVGTKVSLAARYTPLRKEKQQVLDGQRLVVVQLLA
jgi:hypothetical protein